MNERIVWLGTAECAAPDAVGGKAASLNRLVALHPVPPAFCLTADAFGCARRAVAGGLPALPTDLRDEIDAAYRDLGTRVGVTDPPVAVRSSAIDEDGATASFAGQHETYLNVVGSDALAEAVVRCWESAAAPRALEYRRQRGMGSAPTVAVLVQQPWSSVAIGSVPSARCRWPW